MATKVTVIHEADDPEGVLRVSIGGAELIGYYLVFRGDPAAVRHMLKTVNAVAQIDGTLEDA